MTSWWARRLGGAPIGLLASTSAARMGVSHLLSAWSAVLLGCISYGCFTFVEQVTGCRHAALIQGPLHPFAFPLHPVGPRGARLPRRHVRVCEPERRDGRHTARSGLRQGRFTKVCHCTPSSPPSDQVLVAMVWTACMCRPFCFCSELPPAPCAAGQGRTVCGHHHHGGLRHLQRHPLRCAPERRLRDRRRLHQGVCRPPQA